MSDQLFKVFRSSAGSGKTFTLVKEYLKLCLQSKDNYYFSRILAITFTNKASTEMKQRLIESLRELSDAESVRKQPLLAAVRSELHLSDDEFVSRATNLLTYLLHAYGDLNISTIDRFMLKVVRSFARDLKLPLNFEVEMQQDQLLSEVIATLLSKIGEENAVDEMLFDYSKWKISEGKSWKLEDDLFNSARELYQENSTDLLEAIGAIGLAEYLELIKAYRIKNHDFKEELKKMAERAVKLIETEGMEIGDFSNGKSGFARFFYYLRDGDIHMPNKNVLKAVEKEKLHSAKTDHQARIQELTPQFLEIYNEILKRLESTYTDYISREQLIRYLPAQALMARINQEIESVKQEEQLLNISDLNQLISQVVLEEYIPFIYERIGEKYHHLMVDEFQDTSIMQFQNLLPLFEESLSKGYSNLIVGDAKQSIYRFRGGEVEQFSEMPKIELPAYQEGLSAERMMSIERNFQDIPLDHNYRSRKQMITFNNAFFEHVSQLELINPRTKKIFEGHAQKFASGSKEGGYVELRIQNKEEENESFNYHNCEAIISDLKSRGYAYSDMAILCMANDDIAKMANHLSALEIPIVSAEALKLKASASVQFLIELLRWQQDSNQNASELLVFDFLFDQGLVYGNKSQLQIEYLGKNGKGLMNLLKAHDLRPQLQLNSHENLFQWFERQTRSFGLDRDYDLYLQFFEEFVWEYLEQSRGGVEEFLFYWDERKDKLSIDLPDAGDAVQMMTIHKAKGLEFPIVILPFASYDQRKHYGKLWVEGLPEPAEKLDLALLQMSTELPKSNFEEAYDEEVIKKEGDLLNAIYVAFTRPETALYILSEQASQRPSSVSLPLLLESFKSQLNEVEAGLYSWGELSDKDAISKESLKSSSVIELVHFHSSAWNKKVNLSLEMRSQWKKMEDEVMDSRAYGSLLHEILAQVYQLEDVNSVVDKFNFSGKINALEAESLKAELSDLISSASIAPYFQQGLKVRNESSLLSEAGELLRPDRLIYFENEIVILDYKSGAEKGEHLDQLSNYAKEIAKISGQKVSAKLLYLQSGALKEVA